MQTVTHTTVPTDDDVRADVHPDAPPPASRPQPRRAAGRAPESDDAHRGRPVAATVVGVLAWTLALVAGALLLAGEPPQGPDALFAVVDVMVAAVYGTVAAVVLARRAVLVAWLVALAAVGGGLAAVGAGWHGYTVGRPGLVTPDALGALFTWAWVPGTLALFLVVPWLVRESAPSRWSRAGLALGIATTVALAGQRLLLPETDSRWTIVAAVVVGLLAAGAVAWRHRYGTPAERPGLGLLAIGTAVMALSFVPLVVVPYTSASIVVAVPALHLACQAVYPAAILVTVLRNRLWGIDLAVSRAVVAGLLALGLALVYAGLVWATTSMLGSSTAAQVVGAVGVVLVVQPARQRLHSHVRRLVYGDADSPGRAALRVGSRLTDAADDELLAALAAGVGESLRLGRVSVAPSDGPHTAGVWSAYGMGEDDTGERITVTSGELVVGTIDVAPRPGERLDVRTRTALSQLLPLVAVGLGLVQATREVSRARDAATRARLAERRVIRRELHDGIGPWLSGLRLGLQGARNVVADDPAAADEVLAALQSEVAQRIDDVRALSRSLLPPVLDEQGLAAALDDLVARQAADGFTVRTTELLATGPTALRGLDPRVAAAAYAVASEAVTNAARHAGTAGCTLGVSIEGEQVVVTCTDDGRGRDPHAPDGVGTRSMRERTHELGGTFSTASAADGRGTTVIARLPMTPPREPVDARSTQATTSGERA